MIERGDRAGFALEAGTAVRIACCLAGEHLQCDLASKLDVLDEIHLTDTARPNGRTMR